MTDQQQQKMDAMCASGAIVVDALNMCRELARPGARTSDIDARVEKLIRSAGAKPSFKGYNGYPSSVCISINEQIVHGIPGKRILAEGDIASFDVGAYLGGYHGDAALTVAVGPVSPEAMRLMRTTYECLERAVEQVRPGVHIGDIGFAVQSLAEERGYHVVRDFTGHGVGKKLHERPQIPNFGKPGRGPRVQVGDGLAIEPMLNIGTIATKILADNWTVVTYDGSLSAHYERSMVVTDDGCRVTTPWSADGLFAGQ